MRGDDRQQLSTNARRGLSVVVAMLLVTTSTRALADDDVEPKPFVYTSAAAPAPSGALDDVPPGYHREAHMRWKLALSGGIILAAAHGLTCAVGAASADGRLCIPIVGPVLAIASPSPSRDSATGPGASIGEAATRPLVVFVLATSTIAQAAGAALLIYGLATESSQLVPNKPALRLTPMRIGQDGNGLGVVGAF